MTLGDAARFVGKSVYSADGDDIGLAHEAHADGGGNMTHLEVEVLDGVRRMIPITGARLANDRVVVVYTSEEILQMPPPASIA